VLMNPVNNEIHKLPEKNSVEEIRDVLLRIEHSRKNDRTAVIAIAIVLGLLVAYITIL